MPGRCRGGSTKSGMARAAAACWSARTIFPVSKRTARRGPAACGPCTRCDVVRDPADADRLSIEIEANGFLYNMVRSIVGTLVEVGRGVRDESWPAEVLAAARSPRRRPDRAGAGTVSAVGKIRPAPATIRASRERIEQGRRPSNPSRRQRCERRWSPIRAGDRIGIRPSLARRGWLR